MNIKTLKALAMQIELELRLKKESATEKNQHADANIDELSLDGGAGTSEVESAG